MQQATGNTAAQIYNENVSISHHMSEALHQSLYRVLTLLIAVLPGILAFFVALLLFAAAGLLISWVLRRCLTWVKFDASHRPKERRRLGSVQFADGNRRPCLILGLHSAWTRHRRFGLRYVVCFGRCAGYLLVALSHSRHRRRSSADRGRPDCQIPCPLSSHQRRERSVAIRENPFSRRKVAGSCSYRGYGARPFAGRRKYRRAGVWNSVRRHRSYPCSRRRPRLTRPRQPLTRKPRRTHRRAARMFPTKSPRRANRSGIFRRAFTHHSDGIRWQRPNCPRSFELPRCDASTMRALLRNGEGLFPIAKIADDRHVSAFHAQPLCLLIECDAHIAGSSIVKTWGASAKPNQRPVPGQHLGMVAILQLHPSAALMPQRSTDSPDREWKQDPIQMLRTPSFFPLKPRAPTRDHRGRRSTEMESRLPTLRPEKAWGRMGSSR